MAAFREEFETEVQISSPVCASTPPHNAILRSTTRVPRSQSHIVRRADDTSRSSTSSLATSHTSPLQETGQLPTSSTREPLLGMLWSPAVASVTSDFGRKFRGIWDYNLWLSTVQEAPVLKRNWTASPCTLTRTYTHGGAPSRPRNHLSLAGSGGGILTGKVSFTKLTYP